MSSRISRRVIRLSELAFPICCCLTSGLALAQDLPIEIDSSRVVYNEGQPSATVSVRNKSDIPYLVSVNVTTFCGEGQTCPSTEDFMASPGFRVIHPGENYPFRVVKLAEKLASDRESLYLVEFKLLPSEAKLSEEELRSSRVNFVMAGAMKLFWRPKALADSPGVLRARDMLAAHCTSRGVEFQNRSAYWGTFAVLDADGHSLLSDGPLPMIAPFSNRQFDLKTCPQAVSVAFVAESGMPTSERLVPVHRQRQQ